MTIRINNYNKGFTLAELLIAVSLIIILMGVLFAVINPRGIQQRARDSQRISDLTKIKVALESFFADNRSYPTTNDSWASVSATVPAGLETAYINKIPLDPKPLGTFCNANSPWLQYAYKSNGNVYVLAANMETVSMAQETCPVSGYCTGCGNPDTPNTGDNIYYVTAD